MSEWFPSYSEKLLPPSPLGLAIDWTNPLTDGLIAAYVPGIAGGTDLSGNNNNLTIGTIGSWNVTPDGPALKETDSSAGAFTGVTYTVPAASKLLMGSGVQSQYWRGLCVGNASGILVFGILFNNAYTTPYYLFGVQPGATTWAPTWNSAATFVSGTATTFPSTSGTAPFSIAQTGKVGGNVTPYQDGVALATTAWGSAPTSGVSPTLALGTILSPGAYTLAMTTNLFFIWDREKSSADIAALDQYPYVFLVATEGEEQSLYRALIASKRVNPLLRR